MKIRLSDLTEALEGQNDDSFTVYDTETGETHFIWDGMIDGEDATEEEIEEMKDDDRYIGMPSQYDIHEYEIMRSFIYTLPENRMQDRLFQAISGRGAFRRFREVLEDYGEGDRWYHYRDASIEKIGREWAKGHGIEVIDDVPSDMHYLEEQENETGVRKILVVIDMQNDFIDGSLGTKEAEEIVPAVVSKIKEYQKENVYATRDTHPTNYLETQEGQHLPVEHCIRGTNGWQIRKEIYTLLQPDHIFDKPTFGSLKLAEAMSRLAETGDIEIELVGLCTDICVVSNALLLKAYLPEVKISVDPACCAGVTPEKHAAALETMRSCQIQGT